MTSHGDSRSAPLNDVEEIISKVDKTTFGEDDWNVVFKETKSLAAEWEQISIYLGLPFDLIKGTKSVVGDCYQRWSEALNQWIRQNYNAERFGEPSWRTLLKAIAEVDKRKFKKLAEDHQRKVVQVEPVHCGDVCTNSTPSKSDHEAERSEDKGENDHAIAEDSVTVSNPSMQELFPSKPHFSFPFLNLKKMSPEEKEILHQKLFAESEDMTYKFQRLFYETRKSLVIQRTSVDDLLKYLDCLGAVKPTFNGSSLPVLGCQLPELRKTESVDMAMTVISSYCSFFNYRIVEEIINNVGTEQDKTNLKNYREEFSTYAQHHIFECPSELGDMNEIGHANMIVTLDATYESYTVSHLYAFVSNLQRVLKVPAVSLRLCRIIPGSLVMIFQLPHSVQRAAIFPLSIEQEDALTSLGVVQLSCGNYLFSTHSDEEVEDPTTDRGKDYTDSESGVDIQCAEFSEWASLDIGLAVDKHKDAFSNADSRLWNSSVISDTAAEMTQFSEDPLDRELGDLDIGKVDAAIKSCHSDKIELHLASQSGDLEEVKRLIEEKQMNPLVKVGSTGANALHYAAEGGQIDVMKYFTEEKGHNPASQSSDGWTCLHVAAYHNHYDLVQYLVDKQKLDTMCQTNEGDTPLHCACVGGDASVVIYLINAMRKYLPTEDIVKCRSQHGWSPLHIAALFGKSEIVNLLITQFNSDPLMADNDGKIALHHAAHQGYLDIVEFLVEQKCSATHRDMEKVTPLHLAAQKGHLNIVKYLTLEKRCDPLCTDKNKNTPLHAAALRGKLEVVKFFIENLPDCSPDVKGELNKTPLELARIKGHHKVVDYLECVSNISK